VTAFLTMFETAVVSKQRAICKDTCLELVLRNY
jgi:hypothetical protein